MDRARTPNDDSDNDGTEKHVNPNNSDDNGSVALYWDFENLHAGLMEAKYGKGAYAEQAAREVMLPGAGR